MIDKRVYEIDYIRESSRHLLRLLLKSLRRAERFPL